MQEKKKDVLSLGHAAKKADCSRDTIRRAAQRQELPAQMGPGKRGPQWWVREADLVDWLQSRHNLNAPDAEQSTTAPQREAAQQSTASAARQPEFVDADYSLTSAAQQSKASSARCAAEPQSSLQELWGSFFPPYKEIQHVLRDVHRRTRVWIKTL